MAARAEPSNGLCPNAAANTQQPRDQMSLLAVIVHSEGTSKSSGALQLEDEEGGRCKGEGTEEGGRGKPTDR